MTITFNDVEPSDTGKIGRKKSDVAILGAPIDMASANHTGQRRAPFAIRNAGFWPETMLHCMTGADPMETLSVVDLGDIEVLPGDLAGAWDTLRKTVASVFNNTRCLITLGGDHTVSAKVVAGISDAEKEPITIFHFDAHQDYWRHDPGVEMNHGTWVRNVIENGLVNRVVQFGIRGWGVPRQDRTWADKNDVVSYYATTPGWMNELHAEIRDTSDPIYLSVDIDVLDPAFAPGVAFQEPGGWTSRELFSAVHAVASSGKMIGADVVEVIPDRDLQGITAKCANRVVAQLITGIATAS